MLNAHQTQVVRPSSQLQLGALSINIILLALACLQAKS